MARRTVQVVVSVEDQASQPLRGIAGAISGVGQVAGGVLVARGIEAAAGGLVGLARAGSDVVGMAADLEAQLSGIASVTGSTGAEIGQLKQLIQDLGVDPNLKVSSFEAADAIEMLARNGLATTAILDGAARATVLLANATGGDFALAADISTDAMALFGIKAGDMTTAVDGITSVVTSSKFSVEDYRYALAQAGGVAASVGVGFADFNTSIAGIAPLFASGSDAGTSFKTFLQRLVPSTKPAARAFKELGLMLDDGTNLLFDANGQMKDMAEISGLLNRSLAGLSDGDRNRLFTDAFGTDAMRAAFGLASMTEEEYRALAAQMSKTSAADAAAIRMDNLAGSMEILGGIVETLKIGIGDKFIPLVRRGVDGLANWLGDNSERIVGSFGTIADGLTRALDRFAGGGGGVAGVVAALGISPEAGALLIQSYNRLRDGIGRALATLGEVFAPILDAVKEFGAGALLEIVAFATGGETEFTNLSGILQAVGSTVRDVLTRIVGYVREQWPAWKSQLEEWGRAAWQWIADKTPVALAQLGLWGQRLRQWVVDNLPGWADTLARWAAIAADWLADAIPPLMQRADEFLGQLGEWARNEMLPELGVQAGEWARALWRWIDDDLIPQLGPALLRLDAVLRREMSNLKFTLARLAIDIGAGIADGIISGFIGRQSNLVGAWAEAATGWLGQQQGAISGTATPVAPSGQSGKGQGGGFAKNALGTPFFGGGLTWVRENGPELIGAGWGSRIYSAHQSERMAEAFTNQPSAPAGGDLHLHLEAPLVGTIEVKSADQGRQMAGELMQELRNLMDKGLQQASAQGGRYPLGLAGGAT